MIRDFMKTTRPSVWLCIANWGMTAAMMHPTFATVWVLFLEACLLAAIRWLAKLEGA
jgi:hypothetical protein